MNERLELPRRPAWRILLVIKAQFVDRARRVLGRHDQGAASNVVNDPVRDLQGRKHKGAVRTRASVAAFIDYSHVVNHGLR